jgi:LPS-assembly protein
VGTGVDYRYIRKSGSSGGFYGFGIYDTETKSMRGEIYQKHQEEFSPTLFFRSDIGYVSDRNYLQDYAEAFGEYNRKSIDSYVFLTKHWQRFMVTPELRYTQDLESSSNVTTLQKLPIITFTGIKQKIGPSPLYFALDSNFINFYRESGPQGQRVEVHPTMLVCKTR